VDVDLRERTRADDVNTMEVRGDSSGGGGN
jgi:hypothetical protein